MESETTTENGFLIPKNVFSEKVWAEINQTARQRGQPLGDLLAEAIRSYMASEREREDIK